MKHSLNLYIIQVKVQIISPWTFDDSQNWNLNDSVIHVYHFEVDIWLRLPLSFQVIDISEMKYIKESQMLRQVNLLRNPIQELPDYRLSILFRMPSLTELDRHRVEVEEKVGKRSTVFRCNFEENS